MVTHFTTERLVRDIKHGLAGIPTRIRFLLSLLAAAGTIVWLFDGSPTTVAVATKTAQHSYRPGPGGDWRNFENIFAL